MSELGCLNARGIPSVGMINERRAKKHSDI